MKKTIATFFLSTLLALGLNGAETAKVGVVNFADTVMNSKYGKQEQASFEALKKQLTSTLENTEKQLKEVAEKFNNPEYLDGLSPEAEEELKTKFQALNEEMNRYQGQYYQLMQQANMKVVQTVAGHVATAAEKVCKDKKLDSILNKEAFFYFTPGLDVTEQVIAEMDKNFEKDAKATKAVVADATAPATSATK